MSAEDEEEEPLVGWKPDRDLELLYGYLCVNYYLFLIIILLLRHLPGPFPYMGYPKRICPMAPSGE